LGLDGPGIAEGSPAGFEFGEAMGVAGDDDAVFVHFQAGRFIDGGGDFEWSSATLVPCAQGCAVAEVIEEGASAVSLFVKPGLGLFAGDLGGGFFVFIGTMPEGAAVAAEMPDVGDFANLYARDEFVGFAMGGDPLERPVDHEALTGTHRGNHGIGFLEGGGERFLDHDVSPG